MSNRIRAIVGLGNPGPRYDDTRHNAGRWFTAKLARRWALDLRADNRLGGDIASYGAGEERVILFHPGAYMNQSGSPTRALLHYYKIRPAQTLIAYDELDLPPGVARLKQGGGHGGHNGLRDLFVHLPATDFLRLRIGIGHPGTKDRVVGHVLSRPSRAEDDAINTAIDRALTVVDDVIEGRLERAMKDLHTET